MIHATVLPPPNLIAQGRRVEISRPHARCWLLSTTLENTAPTHLDDDKHSLGERVQDLDGRLALKETGVVASLEDIHDKSADPKQHQPTWE